MSAGAALGHIFAGHRCVQLASVFDPLSARAAASLGYKAMFLAGSVASLAVLGAPDLSLLTLSELAGLARRICRASPLPLLIDADHGFGNALNARRTVDELATAGAAGMTLEDTLLPTPHGAAGTAMIPVDEACAKLMAALDARAGREFMVVGRTSAYGVSGIAEACERVAAYAALGPDAIFVPALRTLAELAAIAEAAGPVPLMAYRLGEIGPEADLAGLGVRLLIMGHAPFANSALAAHDTLAGQAGKPVAGGSARELVDELSQTAAYRDLERRFLSGEDLP